jgi:hypothetical protein
VTPHQALRRARLAWRILRTGTLITEPLGHYGTGATGYMELFGCECQRCGLHSRHWAERPACERTIVRVVA